MSATIGESQAAGAPPHRSASPAISLMDVSKSFRLPHEQYHTLKERMLHPFKKNSYETLQAVDSVTVDIARGEFFGIVGRNGSGKSTLLKCLAGIYDTDGGTLAVHGRLSPFIELGVGFNPELTARDNVIINAIMLGLSRAEAQARFEEIVKFAELEEFMDLRLKNYSSGMHVRLAFSVAIQVDADVLLIDEVLAVGDASFQQKCFDSFARLKESGRTIVFVTHDMGSVERFCDRAMLLDHGKVVDVGAPASIARQYNALNFKRVRAEAKETGGPEILRRAPVAELTSAVFESPTGETLVSSNQGEECRVRIETRFHAEAEDPIFGFSIRNELGHAVFATSTFSEAPHTGRFGPGDTATVRFRFVNWLGPGRHRLTATVARAGMGADLFDLHADTSLIVIATHGGGGAVDLPHTIEISRG